MGEKYLEVAGVVDTEDGAAISVCVGLLILAGIAARDAVCAAALGGRYSGTDHAAAAALLRRCCGAAAALLGRVDRRLGTRRKLLVDLKPGAHYGNALPSSRQRTTAMKAAAELVAAARDRTT